MHALFSAFEPAARIAVATLFNSLWEAALLAVLMALALRLLPNVSATTRYAAWCVALAASLLLPLATALPQIELSASAQHVATSTVASRVQPAAQKPAAPKRHAAVQHAAAPASAPASAPALRFPERLHFALPQYVALALFGLWCVAALLLLVRLAVNLWRLERLKSDALPLPVEYRERLQRWASADKGEREVRLCTCESIEVPVAVGLFDSMILIPKHLLDSLSQSEIDQIILHELAHLRRADDWTNGVQRLIQALFFFNPAVLYIAQQLDLEREVACDDWVVDQTKEVRPYATCLTKMAEATAWPHRPLAAPGVFVTRRGLSVRVERLLRAGRNIRTSVAFGPTGAIVAGLIVLFFALQTVAPSFAFTLPEQQSRAAIAYESPSPKATTPSPKATTPSPATTISVPAQHIHLPARDIHIPAVNVDIPAKHVLFAMPRIPPAPRVRFSMPPDFSSRMAGLKRSLAQSVSQSVSQSVAQAFDGSHGKYNCVGCDYSGQNLSGRSFRGQRLSGADFSKADLRNVDFSNSVLVGIDFSRADLRGASFAGASLTGCDFSHATLDRTVFDGARLTGCDISAAALAPTQMRALLIACRAGCDFSNANLRGQDLRALSISAVDLERADFSGSNLSGSTFRAVDLEHAKFDGARLDNTTFENCGLDGVDVAQLVAHGARVINGGR